jgi:hypothetical protein
MHVAPFLGGAFEFFQIMNNNRRQRQDFLFPLICFSFLGAAYGSPSLKYVRLEAAPERLNLVCNKMVDGYFISALT